ncbi:hypothetical protein ACVWZA_004147 [Sphingomonas sp. UYAg733]
MTGDIWYQQVDFARRGSPAERVVGFTLAGPLPLIRTLATDGLAPTPLLGWSN